MTYPGFPERVTTVEAVVVLFAGSETEALTSTILSYLKETVNFCKMLGVKVKFRAITVLVFTIDVISFGLAGTSAEAYAEEANKDGAAVERVPKVLLTKG